MRLLVLSTGRRVSLIRHLRRAAAESGFSLTIHGTELEADTASLRFCDEFTLVPRTFSSLHHKALQDLVIEHGITHILPGNDLDLMYLSQEGSALPCRLLCSPANAVTPWLSKSLGSQLFSDLQLKSPPWWRGIPKECRYPLILKEDEGYGSVNQHFVEDRKALEALLPRMKRAFIQEFVTGPEFTVDVFSDEHGQVVNQVCRLRQKVRSGVSDVGQVDMRADLLQIIEKIAPQTGLVGPWNIQCIYYDGIYWFLEINPRFSGGIPLTIASGADFATNLLQWAQDLPLTRYTQIKDGLKMMKVDAEIFTMGTMLQAGIGYEVP